MKRYKPELLLSFFMMCHVAWPVYGQSPNGVVLPDSVRLSSFDTNILYGLYQQDTPFTHAFYQGIDASSWPIFLAAPAVAWTGAWWGGDGTNWDQAYRLTVSNIATVIVVQTLKKSIKRYRPYKVLPDIESRSHSHGNELDNVDRESFPSGHAAQAFSIATSLSLSYPRWYVIAPAAFWATSIALSRPWLGVHFPTDILAGALIGAGISVLIHVLDPYITPRSLLADPVRGSVRSPAIRLNISL